MRDKWICELDRSGLSDEKEVTMMGVLMSRKTLSLAGDGVSTEGLLDEEPIVRGLSG
jgi:hypothetical protein